jgi:hypothetical protein
VINDGAGQPPLHPTLQTARTAAVASPTMGALEEQPPEARLPAAVRAKPEFFAMAVEILARRGPGAAPSTATNRRAVPFRARRRKLSCARSSGDQVVILVDGPGSSGPISAHIPLAPVPAVRRISLRGYPGSVPHERSRQSKMSEAVVVIILGLLLMAFVHWGFGLVVFVGLLMLLGPAGVTGGSWADSGGDR